MAADQLKRCMKETKDTTKYSNILPYLEHSMQFWLPNFRKTCWKWRWSKKYNGISELRYLKWLFYVNPLVLQIKKLNPKVVKWFMNNHPAGLWLSWDGTPNLQDAVPFSFHHTASCTSFLAKWTPQNAQVSPAWKIRRFRIWLTIHGQASESPQTLRRGIFLRRGFIVFGRSQRTQESEWIKNSGR